MNKITWENIWMTFLLLVTISVTILIGMCIFKDSKIERYVLRVNRNTETGTTYQITEKVIWGCNYYITLPKEVSLDSTLNIIDRLNKSLKN